MTARPTATDRIFADLRERIVAGELAAGSRHSIYQLADELEVSRTPVREAVLRLADLGLVAIERNRGIRIREVTVADVREVFELRMLLEVPAAALAARTAANGLRAEIGANSASTSALAAAGEQAAFTAGDREFHALVATGMANPRLEAEVGRLRDAIAVRGISTFGRSRPLSEVAAEHAAVAGAIVARDATGARLAMADHLERTGTLLMTMVAAPDESVDADWASDVRAAIDVGPAGGSADAE